MKTTSLRLAVLVACGLLLSGCGGGGVVSPSPRVVIQGQQVIAVGQTTVLFADTLNGADDAYAWSSEDPAYATVTDEGRVTGVAPGTTLVHAVGTDTELRATCQITVVEGPGAGIPNYDAWRGSAHGDGDALAFHVWDALGEIPADCARCHSTYGFRDWLGDDGSPAGGVDAPPRTGTVVECVACHNATAMALETVTFPSGAEYGGLDRDALCMQCHGGRSSTDEIDAVVAAAAAADDDTVSLSLQLRTPHYQGGGATLVGGLARGGYQYAGRTYDARFGHIEDLSSCTDCHDPHTLDVPYGYCNGCHPGASDAEGARRIRMASSHGADYDGDGDREEGVHAEIQGLLARVQQVMRSYAADVAGHPIAYRPNPAPNFFEDLNGNGIVDSDEDVADNQYAHWTARLLRAAYNVQFATNDAGGYAHNAKYVIQLLHDSLRDLNAALPTPLDLTALDRNDPGHFDGSAEAARHWDEEGQVPASCARCHTGSAGLLAFLQAGADTHEQVLPNGLDCYACHDSWATASLRRVYQVAFPGGAVHADADDQGMVCMVCHTGRASTATIDVAIADADLSFQNVHYLPAAGVLLGSQVAVGYQYPGKSYEGARSHIGGTSCLDCHDAGASLHTFEVTASFSACAACHGELASIDDLRLLSTSDYDGDGDAGEPLAAELETLAATLLTEIQAVATAGGDPIAYDAHAYPYFFHDTDSNGTTDPTEAVYDNRYAAWTPALLKAAHNYQIARKEPGAWAHNFAYAAQLLIDSVEDLGGDIGGMVRP